MRRLSCVAVVLVSAFVLGCGSSDKPGSPGSGGAGGSGGTGGGVIPMSCTDPFAKLEAPYSANNAGYDLVVADAAGLVVSGIVDGRQLADPLSSRDYPDLIFTIDMQGTVATIWSGDTMPLALAVDASTVYFHSFGLSGGGILSVPRTGGTATVLVERDVHAGPVLVGGKLYYAGETASYDEAVFELDPATGTSTVLSDRGDMVVDAFTADDQAVYWTESDGTFSGADYPLYKLNLADRSVVQLGALSPDAGTDHLMLAGDTLFVGGIVDISYRVSRVVPGGAPVVVVSETTGAIAFTQDTAYYGSRAGLVKTPLDFSVTTAVPGTSGKELSAVAVGPQYVWYAEFSCIYRMAR